MTVQKSMCMFLTVLLLLTIVVIEVSQHPALAQGIVYGPVKRGETLWDIAKQVQTGNTVTQHQVLLALLATNPQNFKNPCNFNTLKVDNTLRIPILEKIQWINQTEAVVEFNRQNQQWQAYQQTQQQLTCSEFVLTLIEQMTVSNTTVEALALSSFLPFLTDSSQVVKIGVLSFQAKEITLTQWQPTINYLSTTINDYTFELTPLHLPELESAIEQRRVDFILLSAGDYVRLEHRYHLNHVVTLTRLEQDNALSRFGGVIFTRANCEHINTLQDVKGKHFLAVSKDSVDGFLVAWEQFHNLNINPFQDFAQIIFSGTSYEEVVLRVQTTEEIEVGTVRTGVLEKLASQGRIALTDFKVLNKQSVKDFPFLLSTQLYPEWPLARLPHTKETLAKQVAIALLALPAQHPAAKEGGYTGWTIPANYQPVHDLMKKLQVGAYEKPSINLKNLFIQNRTIILLVASILLIAISLLTMIIRINKILQKEVKEQKKINHALQQKIKERKQFEERTCQSNEELQHEITQHKRTIEQLHNIQEQLIRLEKMARLGQLIASITHEINTPLGAIHSAVRHITDFLSENLEEVINFFNSLSVERQQDFLNLLRRSMQQTPNANSEEIRHLKYELAQQLTERKITDALTFANILADMGIYKNIEPCLPLLQDAQALKILEVIYQLTSLQKSIYTILTASEFIMHIVSALKRLAHNEPSGEKTLTQITEGIETVLTLYQHQLKHKNITIIRHYETIPPILCYADELNQVWMNLIHNALQAMNHTGTLKIVVALQEEAISISITDSGIGIPDEIKYTIFKPFFTTKPIGEGCGLGLDIVKKIVEKHNGKISVESKPGCTTFAVFLPLSGQIHTREQNYTHLHLMTVD